MPCFDERNTAGYADKVWSVKYDALQSRCDLLARLLCELCTQVESSTTEIKVSPELHSWWQTHKVHDAKQK